MLAIEANGQKLEAKKGDTILQALKRGGIHVPTICHMEGLLPSGTCRMCVVEVEGAPGLVPACSFPAAEGMRIHTSTPTVLKTRKAIVELLLSNHPDDCLYCARNGKCDLSDLAREHGIRNRVFRGLRKRKEKDISSPSIVRDPEKCILCGKCVRVCEEVQGVSAIDFINRGSKAFVGTAFDEGMNVSCCINCGQCILVCPTAALTERSYVDEVMRVLADPGKTVVVQHAPAVSVSIAEEFGFKPGTDIDGQMVAALRRVGFKRVFDTSFTADLTIMEEGSELIQRITEGGPLPMFTSCSPGWIKFVEQFYPELLPNVSTCKSPQQMMGAVIKTFFAKRENLDPKDIVSVSIMPCTAKKFECARPEMGRDYVPDVDYVLTTRELAELFRIKGVDPGTLEPEGADTPFGERSSAGKLFGASGGVMEAAVRSAFFLLTGDEMKEYRIQDLRGMKGSKELRVKVGDLEVGAAVVSSLGQARRLMDEIKAGRSDLHFVEVMTCPGGCINGGGQPLKADLESVKARMAALYTIDKTDTLRVSHRNSQVQRLYTEFLGKPLGHLSHQLLHTKYQKREVLQ
ncbi:NADH-dependent [FeFe] hydrogenase, group A6 [Geothrix sp. 21YS21S-2]|uniref:NADH-dependent [FeFe] hydrogenase, group A6 n=1 Tax=Geothrix sp. 21YS21S-2 TaxID=3068893 RepID=UPI0027BA2272|nr:NADH-dependent [FeFe] hydrogenase, group A6 [Geothrix sp. 21YS21S-2]